MTMLVSEEEAVSLRVELAVFLVHSYTRTPRVAGTANEDGSIPFTDGTPVSGVPCQYNPITVLLTENGGRVTVNRPSLLVAYDDDSVVADKITDIRNETGDVLLAGPVYVETSIPGADFGPVLDRVLALVGARPEA